MAVTKLERRALSINEQEVITMIRSGFSYKQIAKKLNIPYCFAKFKINQMQEKLSEVYNKKYQRFVEKYKP